MDMDAGHFAPWTGYFLIQPNQDLEAAGTTRLRTEKCTEEMRKKWAMGPPPEVIVSCAGILDIDKAAGNPKCLAGGRHFVRPDTVRTVSASKRVVTDDRPPQYVRPEMLAPGTSDWSQIGARRLLCYVAGVRKGRGPFCPFIHQVWCWFSMPVPGVIQTSFTHFKPKHPTFSYPPGRPGAIGVIGKGSLSAYPLS
jgi:hypothetical protein